MKQALIFGVADYKEQKLINPINDAKIIASSLKARGFNCTVILNPDKASMLDALKRFSEDETTFEISLCYFAGHAVEFNGAGYVFPSDVQFPLSAGRLEYFAISIADVIEYLPINSMANIVVIDACRDWPLSEINDNHIFLTNLEKARSRQYQWENLLMSFSTSSGRKASDCDQLPNTHFSNSLSEKIRQHNLSVEECIKFVNQEVVQKTKGSQRPWYYSSLNHFVTFSDLSDYKLLQSYNVAIDQSLPLSLSEPNQKDELLITGAGHHVKKIDFYGGEQKSRFCSKHIVVEAFEDGDTTICLNDDGSMYCIGLSTNNDYVVSKITRPNGFKFSVTHQKIIITSNDGIEVFCRNQNSWESEFYSPKIKNIYSVHFLNNPKAILGTDNGNLYVLDLITFEFQKKKIYGKYAYIYSISDLNDTLLLSGSSGLLVTVNPKNFKIISDYSIAKEPQTPLALRGSLLHVADDECIQRYIFDRQSLPNEIISELENQISSRDIVCASVCSTSPIVAVGTDEGNVYIFDSRDMQLIQCIQVLDNLRNIIRDIQFTNSGMLAVLKQDGSLNFYASVQSLKSAPTFSLETSS